MRYILILVFLSLPNAGLLAEPTEVKMQTGKNNVDSHYRIDKVKCKFDVGWTAWKPYQYFSSDNKLVGLQIELLKLIEEQLGCQFHYHQNDWLNSVTSIKKGDLDFIGNATINPERKKFALFSEPYRQDLVVLYIRSKDKVRYKNASLQELFKLHHFKLGLIEGAVYDEQLLALQHNPEHRSQFRYIDKSERLLDLLVEGTIDGYFEDPLIFDHSLNGRQISDAIEVYPLEIKIGNIHFMFSKNRVTQSMVNRFNHALKIVLTTHPEKFEWFEQQ